MLLVICTIQVVIGLSISMIVTLNTLGEWYKDTNNPYNYIRMHHIHKQ